MDDTADDAHSEVAFSRSAGLFGQTGNADCEVKTRLSFDDAEALRREARVCGLNTSEFLRVIILVRLHGVEKVTSLTAEHLALVAGKVPEKGRAP